MAKVMATARVQITVDIDVEGAWDSDCTVGQVQEQAKESALTALRNGLLVEGLKSAQAVSPRRAVIVGAPRVMPILLTES